MWACTLEPATKVHERDNQFGQVQERIENTISLRKRLARVRYVITDYY